MDAEIIINQQGPLPITTTITTASDGPAMLVVAGSVWSQSANNEIGINVVLEGERVGVASIYSNGASTHRAVVPAYIPITLDKQWPSPTEPPTYTVELVASTPATVSDSNDSFVVVLHV